MTEVIVPSWWNQIDVEALGQSTLGLPTTLNLALAAAPGDERFPPQGPRTSYFVGLTTPRGQMLPALIGAHRLQQRALALGAEAIVVDTTGLVDKALKQWKIELLAPRVLVAVQRGTELEPILWPLRRDGRLRCIDLQVSPHAVARTREARIARRRDLLARYFQDAQPRLVELRRMAVFNVERLAAGALLAFQDAEGFTLGLGAVKEVDRLGGTFIVHSPLPGLKGVTSLRLGVARWDLAKRREF